MINESQLSRFKHPKILDPFNMFHGNRNNQRKGTDKTEDDITDYGDKLDSIQNNLTTERYYTTNEDNKQISNEVDNAQKSDNQKRYPDNRKDQNRNYEIMVEDLDDVDFVAQKVDGISSRKTESEFTYGDRINMETDRLQDEYIACNFSHYENEDYEYGNDGDYGEENYDYQEDYNDQELDMSTQQLKDIIEQNNKMYQISNHQDFPDYEDEDSQHISQKHQIQDYNDLEYEQEKDDEDQVEKQEQNDKYIHPYNESETVDAYKYVEQQQNQLKNQLRFSSQDNRDSRNTMATSNKNKLSREDYKCLVNKIIDHNEALIHEIKERFLLESEEAVYNNEGNGQLFLSGENSNYPNQNTNSKAANHTKQSSLGNINIASSSELLKIKTPQFNFFPQYKGIHNNRPSSTRDGSSMTYGNNNQSNNNVPCKVSIETSPFKNIVLMSSQDKIGGSSIEEIIPYPNSKPAGISGAKFHSHSASPQRYDNLDTFNNNSRNARSRKSSTDKKNDDNRILGQILSKQRYSYEVNEFFRRGDQRSNDFQNLQKKGAKIQQSRSCQPQKNPDKQNKIHEESFVYYDQNGGKYFDFSDSKEFQKHLKEMSYWRDHQKASTPPKDCVQIGRKLRNQSSLFPQVRDDSVSRISTEYRDKYCHQPGQ